MDKIKNLTRGDRGSTIVEVAIVLPVIFLLVFSFLYYIELSRVSTVMELAVNEASRSMAINKDYGIAKAKAENIMQAGHLTLIGEGAYSVILKDGNITAERSVNKIPFTSNRITMTKTANYREEDVTKYYNRGSSGPGWTGSAY